MTDDGRVVLGLVGGAGAVYDLTTWTYAAVLPGALFTRWSPDGRYAVHGHEGHAFHGNWCH